jgi:hypothetical protein
MAVACGSDSAAHSPCNFLIPHYIPLLLTPPPSVLALEDDLHVLPPTRTYSKTLVHFYKICYYFCHIILSRTELVDMNIRFSIIIAFLKVCYYFCHINLSSTELDDE